MFAKQRLFLTAARDLLVAEGDGRAAFLYAAEGDEIPDSAAELFGLVDGAMGEQQTARPARPKAPAVAKPARAPKVLKPKKAAAAKEQKPAQDKEHKPAENKEQAPEPDKASDGTSGAQA